jgi:ankyrin repeat protein
MKHLLLTTIAAVVLVGCGPSVDIFKAARTGNIEVVKQYLAAGEDVNAKDNFGRTPFHLAAFYGRKELVELLIDNGADVNAKDNFGRTPFHLAAFYGRKELVELLIDNGADVNAKDNNRQTPLDKVETKRHELADLLRKHGGKTGEELKAEAK